MTPALAGRAPALAAACAAADGDAAARAAVDTLLRMTDEVVATAVRRPPRTPDAGRCWSRGRLLGAVQVGALLVLVQGQLLRYRQECMPLKHCLARVRA